MEKISERLEEVERVNAKLEKKNKDKEFKFTKTSCETQYKFNSKLKEICAEKMRVELKKHFREGLPAKIEELIKEDVASGGQRHGEAGQAGGQLEDLGR